MKPDDDTPGPDAPPADVPEGGGEGEGRPVVAGIRRTRRVLWITVAVAVPLFLLVVVLATRPAASTREVRSPLLNKAAPAAESTTIDGESVKLSDLKGKWVVVNFFATWCVPCRIEHSELQRFQDTHQTLGDASVFGVVFGDSAQAVKEFRADEGGTWPMLTDPGGRIALTFGVSGVPESFLVDPEGIVRSRIAGGVRAVDLDRLLAEARAGG